MMDNINGHKKDTVTLASGESMDADLFQQISEVVEETEDRPAIVKTLTSTRLEDLKQLSEVPRRLVPHMTVMDVVIAMRKKLIQNLLERGNHADSLLIAQVSRLSAMKSANEVYRESFLTYMKGNDRKLLGEVLEAWVATQQTDEGKELDAN